MSATWLTIGVLAVLTAATKGAGPLALGGRDLPTPFMRVIELLAPAILAALIVVGTFTNPDGEVVLDARAAGLAAAAGVLAVNRRSLLGAAVAAALVAAGVRTLS